MAQLTFESISEMSEVVGADLYIDITQNERQLRTWRVPR
jgi:hypothetical protein